jgi:NAD(P)-dependent dehydrogenase (short-subunit alcohol dehydrogenase family)
MTVALVTGGTKNIGLAIARVLGSQGHTVIVNGRDGANVDRAVEALRTEGLTAHGQVADVANEADVEQMAQRVRREHGTIGILVNNAGLRYHGPLAETPLADWQRVVDVVLTGSFLTTRALLPGMTDAGWGRIVNIAGISAQSGAAGRVPVVAAKAGIIGLTKATALEVADRGVTANALSPGFIDTDRSPTLGDPSVASALYGEGRQVPVGRVGLPEDIAAACGFLCSDAAGFITGQVLSINGGKYL